MTQTKGIQMMQNEGYALPKETEKTRQKTEFPWWGNPKFIIFLTLALSALDCTVLYTVMDAAMTQDQWLGIVTAFGIALVLNMLPLMTAKFAHQWIYHIKRYAAMLCIMTIVAFMVLFAGTVGLRFAYQDRFGSEAETHLVNEASVAETDGAESDKTNNKSLAIVILLSIEPLVTSIFNFGLAFVSDDELREEINHNRIRKCELVEAESDMRAYIKTMESPEEYHANLLLVDKKRKLASKDEVAARSDVLRAIARKMLAEYVDDAGKASYVLDPQQEISNTNKSEEFSGEEWMNNVVNDLHAA